MEASESLLTAATTVALATPRAFARSVTVASRPEISRAKISSM
jgi:hypothetical protein